MNSINKKIVERGIKNMQQAHVAICSIVRDCNKELIKNIPVIEKLRDHFISSKVFIYENDSKDETRKTLEHWKQSYPSINICSEDHNHDTIPNEIQSEINRYFSFQRISKMVKFRNKYLEMLATSNYCPDFVIIIDLDISNINLKGIAHSFGLINRWDVICANGYSYSPRFTKRYHDTYALVELGNENEPQTEELIYRNQRIWSYLKPGGPLIPIYSAFGGLSIYRFEAIRNKRYSVINNDAPRVEVRCEHYDLCKKIREDGYTNIFINPNMTLKNQTLTFKKFKEYINGIIK